MSFIYFINLILGNHTWLILDTTIFKLFTKVVPIILLASIINIFIILNFTLIIFSSNHFIDDFRDVLNDFYYFLS